MPIQNAKERVTDRSGSPGGADDDNVDRNPGIHQNFVEIDAAVRELKLLAGEKADKPRGDGSASQAGGLRARPPTASVAEPRQPDPAPKMTAQVRELRPAARATHAADTVETAPKPPKVADDNRNEGEKPAQHAEPVARAVDGAHAKSSGRPEPATTPEEPVAREKPAGRDETYAPPRPDVKIGPIIEGDRGPLMRTGKPDGGKGGGKRDDPPRGGGGGGGGNGRRPDGFHQRVEMPNFAHAFHNGLSAVRKNILIVMVFTIMTNVLVLAIPIYLFQISDRVLTSRSVDTLVMLTIVVAAAVVLQMVFDAIRRFILMRTAVEVGAQLGAPVLAAAARSSLNGSARDYQVLGDLQQIRSFITSGTLLSILDVPLAPLFVVAVLLIHPHLGMIVIVSSVLLMSVAYINQRMTAQHFAEANGFLSRATLHVDSMSRNSQIINAMAMIPEAVRIWGRDTALALRSQVTAQDRNIVLASVSKSLRLLTQVVMLGWGAYLAIDGQMTGGMVIAASIIASRALTPVEGAIEGWNSFTQFRASFQRVRGLLQTSPLNFQRLLLPSPQGRLDVDRVLYVPPPTKKVILNGISFSLMAGESLAVIGNSGSGKTTLGKMLVGSILPTSGNVRLDLMDLRNWDQRQFGENIGYLPQDVQLFPGTIKANIARMREDASDREIYEAAMLADVHELIASFPQGYETMVAADGAPLSGGQKQRIALARAFFGNPRLVVLDEPNSNLDTPGEVALSKALLHARQQKITVVTITQRTALLSHVDKIMVLNSGTVAMFGSRTDVLKVLARETDGPQKSIDTP